MKNLIDYIQEGLRITADTEIDDIYDTPGVYAYFKGGYMTDDEDYIKKHKKDAIGVAVISEVDDKLHRIVVDKKNIGADYCCYGGYDLSISGATIAADKETALKDMNGKENTVAISKACHAYCDNYRTGSAAEDCRARFNRKGYLPSLGELQTLYDNKSAINTIMSAIGDVMDGYYWSSTLRGSNDVWTLGWFMDSTSRVYGGTRRGKNHARAVMEI